MSLHLPNFLCIGTQKAGTSWLFEQVIQHPNLWMPPIKELHYFDHLFCEDNRKWTRWHIEQSAKRLIRNHLAQSKIDFGYINYISSLASGVMFDERWYSKAFDRPLAKGRLLGDFTPEYCTIGIAGIKYMHQLLQSPKLIWLVRNPVDRFLSQLRMNLSRNNTASFDGSSYMEYARDKSLINRGALSRYIVEWESIFSPLEILYIPYKMIALNPLAVLRDVENHLGIAGYDNYKAVNSIIHPTPKYEIPDSVVGYISALMEEETRFLKERFGKDFFDLI